MAPKNEVIIKLPDDLFFTPTEIGQLLKFSRTKAYAMVKTGEIRGFYVGGQPRVTRNDLETYIKSRF